MKRIYLDHASTSFPKADGVPEAVFQLLKEGAYNIGRGQYTGADNLGLKVLEIRQAIARFFGAENFRHVVFTQNITHSLNLVLKGLLKPGDHVLCSSMEHNAVMRPLAQLSHLGIEFSAVPCDIQGRLDPQELENAIRPPTKAVVITAASNVCGTCLPLFDIAEICKRRGLHLLIDSAQLAGHYPIDLSQLNCSAFCFTGHKALQGPQGIGGIILNQELAEKLEPLISGGTGSFSDSEELPPSLPDRYEAGTQNIPGIIGLGAAIDYLQVRDLVADFAHEMALCQFFLNEIVDIFPNEKVRILGLGPEVNAISETASLPNRVGVISLDFPQDDNAEIAWKLEQDYGIMTRTGLHCAPRAHRTLGSFPQGSIRFSLGRTSSKDDLIAALNALCEILARA